jgi:hypothetical protein
VAFLCRSRCNGISCWMSKTLHRYVEQ